MDDFKKFSLYPDQIPSVISGGTELVCAKCGSTHLVAYNGCTPNCINCAAERVSDKSISTLVRQLGGREIAAGELASQRCPKYAYLA